MTQNWEANVSTVQGKTALTCKKCRAVTPIHSAKVQIVFCPKCQAVYSKEIDKYNGLNKEIKKHRNFFIPLGEKATIDDVEYTLVGCAEKHEKGSVYNTWQEYVLIDNSGNYAYLNVSNGHWCFLKEVPRIEAIDKDDPKRSFTYEDGNDYEYFTSYYQVTVSAMGEFPYDVIDVKTRHAYEWVSPPYILSHEHHNKQDVYFYGHYMTPSQVARAFSNSALALPPREGTGGCQPFYFGIMPWKFIKLSFLFLLFSLPVFLIINHTNREYLLSSQNFSLSDTVHSAQDVSPTFQLLAPATLLRFDTRSNIDNDWIEADITLVNESTGAERTFISGVEYYHGYDDEGSWSEGTTARSDYLNSIPPGTYHIETRVYTSQERKYKGLSLTVYHDFPTMRNYWILFAALVVINIILGILNNKFESGR